MTIDPIDNLQHVSLPKPNAEVKNEQKTVRQEVGFEKTTDVQKQQELVARLSQGEEIRPEKVSEGKALLNDPNFPSSSELDDLAKALLSPLAGLQ